MHDGPGAHEHVSDADRAAFAQFIWAQDNVKLTTVGIDIGSSTSHLLFARVHLRRQSQRLSSRFDIVSRDILFKSKIILTPFLEDGTIDSIALGAFINAQYIEAGLTPDMVDTGAVILTGEAIKRRNAEAIAELFASQSGKFVCATAGHKLESALAAHGSGAVALSRRFGSCILHVDIGGGTTKLALIDNGIIRSVSAFGVGGRLIAQEAEGGWKRLDDSALYAAADLGLTLTADTAQDAEVRRAIATRVAACAIDQIAGHTLDDLGQKLQLTEPLLRDVRPTAISFSGGVAEYLFHRETGEFGDIAQLLADALRTGLAMMVATEVVDPGQGIRATVIGASQFTVQVSGKTIFYSDETHLQVHNIPITHIPQAFTAQFDATCWQAFVRAALALVDHQTGQHIALAFSWHAPPEYRHIRACAEGILHALGTQDSLLLLVVDGDIGRSLGLILCEELNYAGPLISLDGLQLQQFDLVDIGGLMQPAGVVPVIVKSLVFS